MRLIDCDVHVRWNSLDEIGQYLDEPGAYVWGRDGEILRCPWHGWEFDLLTGRALFDPHVRVKTYAVEIQGDQVVLIL